MKKKNKISLKDGALLVGVIAFIGTAIASIFSESPPLSPEERAAARRRQEAENRKKTLIAKLRARVFKRARGRCEKCDQKSPLDVYYIVGPYQNGQCTYNNLQGLCTPCSVGETKLS